MNTSAGTPLEALLKRDRQVVVGALLVVIALSWIYILAGAGMGMDAVEMTQMSGGLTPDSAHGAMKDMPGMEGSMTAPAAHVPAGKSMMAPATWTPRYAVLMFFMWWIMMVAMMLPSASPMILLHALVSRKAAQKAAQTSATAPSQVTLTSLFTGGYLAAWAGFSVVAVAAQWALERSGLLLSVMTSTSALLGGALLTVAGVWQLTPLKHACLRHCRSPIQFISTHWRSGPWGAFRMGLHHGAFCLGCCWFLMALLFYGGVMNLYWIIGLAVFVLLEKTLPAGHWMGRITGLALIAWGIAVLASVT